MTSFLISIIQSRIGSDFFVYVNHVLPRVLGFKGVSFYLFDTGHLFALSNPQYSHFSLLGDIAYKFISPFWGADLRGIFRSSDFSSFGPSNMYSANAFYPWSAFLFGSFGYLGLILKLILNASLLFLFARFHLLLSFCNWFTFIVFVSPFANPVLGSSGLYAIAAIVTLDILIKSRRSLLSTPFSQ